MTKIDFGNMVRDPSDDGVKQQKVRICSEPGCSHTITIAVKGDEKLERAHRDMHMREKMEKQRRLNWLHRRQRGYAEDNQIELDLTSNLPRADMIEAFDSFHAGLLADRPPEPEEPVSEVVVVKSVSRAERLRSHSHRKPLAEMNHPPQPSRSQKVSEITLDLLTLLTHPKQLARRLRKWLESVDKSLFPNTRVIQKTGEELGW